IPATKMHKQVTLRLSVSIPIANPKELTGKAQRKVSVNFTVGLVARSPGVNPRRESMQNSAVYTVFRLAKSRDVLVVLNLEEFVRNTVPSRNARIVDVPQYKSSGKEANVGSAKHMAAYLFALCLNALQDQRPVSCVHHTMLQSVWLQDAQHRVKRECIVESTTLISFLPYVGIRRSHATLWIYLNENSRYRFNTIIMTSRLEMSLVRRSVVFLEIRDTKSMDLSH